MGIDVSHSLLVGADYEELEEFIHRIIDEDEENEDSTLDHAEVIHKYFETASPYYDSPIQDWFIGFQVPNLQEVNEDWWEVVREAAHQFQLLTGVPARIRGGAHVW